MPGDVNDSIAGIIKTFGCIKHEYIYIYMRNMSLDPT